jgi:aldehyde:ferredoxin oxidoreductase
MSAPVAGNLETMKGMHNKLLSVDLSAQSSEESAIDSETLTDYLGGRGLGVKLFTSLVNPRTDPLSPDNCLVFATGPLTGSIVPTSGRFSLVTKSPLTGLILYSNTGGSVGPALKSTGYDCLIVSGRLDEPSYVLISEGQSPQIVPCGDLWGLDTLETQNILESLGLGRFHSLMIGPAGENGVLYASIMNDGNRRAFGRGGSGAVMGAENLKAIVIKVGKAKPDIDNSELLTTYVKSARDKMKVAPITNSSLPMFGTAGLLNVINELGMLGIRNFQIGYSHEAENLSGETIREQIFEKDEGCHACPIRCGRMTKTQSMNGKGPEFESLLLGTLTNIFDLVTVAEANYHCNLLGLDTVSTAGTISCAMELREKGALNDDMIQFGNKDILIPLIEDIAYRRGIGEELASGSARLAAKHGMPDAAVHVKGMELPAYDPRGAIGHALGYATSNRGGCHLTGYLVAMEVFAAPKKIPRASTGSKADLLVLKQHQSAIEDSLIVCKFAGYALGFDFYSRFATAATGEDLNITRLMKIGERIYNLERLFNVKAGLSRKDDTLPKRFLTEPLSEGLSKGRTVPLDSMLEDYYRLRDWDETGAPSKAKLEELGIRL